MPHLHSRVQTSASVMRLPIALEWLRQSVLRICDKADQRTPGWWIVVYSSGRYKLVDQAASNDWQQSAQRLREQHSE